jgi:hypothetical protein
MGMGPNAAGDHDLTARIDHLFRRVRENTGKGYGHNLLAYDPYIPVPHPSRGDHASSLNEHV